MASSTTQRVVVLHVVESWGGGVRAATLRFVAATPELEHHLLRGARREEFDRQGDAAFASVRDLPASVLLAIGAIRRAIDAAAPDVVHAHSFLAGLLVRLSARSTSARRIAYSPHCFAFERRELTLVTRGIIRLIERMLTKNTDTVVACSAGEAASARALGARRVVFVPNVAEVPAMAMMEHRDPRRLVAVGRLAPQKDPDFFRSVATRLSRSIPGLEATWVGDGDPRARRRLLGSDIRVTGWVDSFTAATEVARSGLYLHTARWEGFPISILEAIELGVPVLARDVPTLSGSIVSPGIVTPAQMADAAEALLAGGGLARQLNLDLWRALLEQNTPQLQRRALGEVYWPAGIDLLINGKWLAASQSGMPRYASEVARRVVEANPRARVVVPRDAALPAWLKPDRTVTSRFRGVVFEQFALPRISRGSMLLNLAGAAPLAKRDQLVVMHDVTPERYPRTASRFVPWYRLMNRVLARRARHLVTVSEFSRAELGAVLGEGVTPDEALSCPVIAAGRASIPEVAGAGALYFDPARPQDVVTLVWGLDAGSRQQLIDDGHRNVLRYSWDDTARAILDLARTSRTENR